ncbi:hypothetical protein KKC91_03775 [bacterium]|nr:hypothetical protein [bacterium]
MEWETLDKIIGELESMINFKTRRGFIGVMTIFVPTSITWGDIWAKAAEIQNGFKEGVCYPTKAQREGAWSRFNSLRDDISRLSKDERDSRRWKSESLKSEILSRVESARPDNLFGLHLVNIEEMKALGHVVHDAGEMLSEHKREMLGEHKQECFDAIQRMRGVHDAWWDKLKEEGSRRHEDFQSRVRRNLEGNYERHRKATHALEHCQNRADELRSQIASAWNDDWATRAEGWLSELEDKITDIEHSIEQIEEWIRADESNLR